MQEVAAMYISWSATLYSWARAVVGIVLWFWVVSGVIFGLRFLAFVLLDRDSASSSLATASASIGFGADQFKDEPRQERLQD